MSEPRCPRCGALVAADAEWCGQCLSPLLEAAPAAGPAGPGTTAVATASRFERAADGQGPLSAWRCPTCDAANGLEVHACRICGTPFSRLFEGPMSPPAVSPDAAAAWSLLLPGLGHWFAGRRPEAVARFVLAAWVGGMLVVLLASRGREDGFGMAGGLVGLFAVAAFALWAEAAIDARRAVSGLRPVVSSRAMLWACVALVGLSILLATVLTLPSLQTSSGGPVP
jgi:uncharacterized membrane protein (GlpM family)